MGNYHSFGSRKFIPELDSKEFLKILKSHPLAQGDSKEAATYQEIVAELYPQIEKEIYAIDKPYTQLGFPYEGGVTGYFGRNMDKEDLDLVKEFLISKKIDLLNTRAFK